MKVPKGYPLHKRDARPIYLKWHVRLAKKCPEPHTNTQPEALEELPFKAESCIAEGFFGGSLWSAVTTGSFSMEVAKGLPSSTSSSVKVWLSHVLWHKWHRRPWPDSAWPSPRLLATDAG